MIRVLHVSREFEPRSSGVARHIHGLALALAGEADLHLEILAPRVDAEPGPYTLSRGSYAALGAAIARNDILHVHGARTPLAAAAAHLAALRGTPVLYTPHCYYDSGGSGKRLLKRAWDLSVERSLMRRSQAVILLHDGWPADLARRGLQPRRTLIVPNCIDDASSAADLPAQPLDGQPAILSIGRLDPIKRLDDVIAALRDPALGDAVLHLVGRGDDRPRLEALAQRLGVGTRVRFHGWQDDAATQRMMRGCDLMVLASEREGLPTVILEALLAGVPIACSDIDGNRAITQRVGWQAHFPLGAIPALAACLKQTAGRRVSAEVIEAVRSQFTWQRRAAELAGVYRQLHAQSQRA
jgi:glycosyltransferase involved in cell wall biosynthesis